MALELAKTGLNVVQQAPIQVYYGVVKVGEYYADLFVNDTVIVELKSAQTISKEHVAQLLNYLKATEIEVGLILNFGPKPQIKRKIYDNYRKSHLSKNGF